MSGHAIAHWISNEVAGEVRRETAKFALRKLGSFLGGKLVDLFMLPILAAIDEVVMPIARAATVVCIIGTVGLGVWLWSRSKA